MKIRLLVLLLGLTFNAAAEQKAEQNPGALPPEASVIDTLHNHPRIREADSFIVGETAQRAALVAGSHEWTVRLGGQQRRTDDPGQPGQRYQEWNVALERPLRLYGKAELDEAMGNAGVSQAELAARAVRHETSRNLLSAWFNWLRENVAAEQWREQVALVGRQAAALKRRHQLGDASRIEQTLADAALAQAEAQYTQARVRQQMAEAGLQRLYPALPVTPPSSLPEPVEPGGDEAKWRERIIENNHDLGLVRLEQQRSSISARRAERERYPDPSVGIQYSRERSGAEHVAGLFVSIPLAGEKRRRDADTAQAQARMAEYRAQDVRQKIEAEAAGYFHSALGAYRSWLSANTAATQLEQVARMTQRAYALGEGSLDDFLTRQRLANEARLGELQGRLDAIERYHRLQLEARQLWDFGGAGG
ncbi:TolC family protein [Azonexus sp.]|uniref:TolC family protein n=1 Tax=Azonexus sp. TaxID=1872668 RepID=UPI0027BB13BD|nr:TolC family protein [Azonexus sp.]